MIYFIHLFTIILLFICLKNILFIVFNVEDKNITKRFKKINNKKVDKKHSYIFAKFIVVPHYYKLQIENDLKTINVDMTAEEYLSDGIYKGIPLFIIGLILFIFRVNFIGTIIIFISFINLFRNFTRLKRALLYRNTLIEDEIPNMIRFFITEVKNKTNIKIIFTKYREIAKNIIPEIDRAISELNIARDDSDNIVYALQNFADSLNLPIVQDFVTGLIDVSKGKNQDNYLILLEREMRAISIKNLDRKSLYLDKFVKNQLFILIGTFLYMLVSIIVIYAVYIIKSM